MGKSKSNWAIFGALAVMIFLLLYLIFFGGLTVFQNILQGGSGIGDRQLELPPGDDDCSQYDIYDEFVDEYGITAITGAKNACLAVNGYWFEEEDEIGCLFPPGPVSCDQDFLDDAEDFCEDDLKATYQCDSSIGYVGCYCNMVPWEPCEEVCDNYDFGEFIENANTECDWGTQIDQCCCWDEDGGGQDGNGEQSDCQLSFPYCDSNCDSGQWCMEIVPNTLFFQQPWCDCVPLYYDTDCTDFCSGQYGYDYGELAHSHYDCDDYEEYIDGCCCGYYQDGLFCEPYVEYYFTEECECPPGYHKENVNRSYWWCVADGII